MTILETILEQKRTEVIGLAERLKNAKPTPSRRDFREALLGGKTTPSLIAEIKRKSPSKGELFPDLDAAEIAHLYASSGAAAVSVLTDETFFSGSLADLHQASEEVNIPLLRKDFILVPEQILDARLSGADGVLLMVSVLREASMLRDLREYAESLSMHALVEVHDEGELAVAIESGAKIIGVNARGFSDLSVDQNVFQTLLPKIPSGIVRVAESGFHTRQDVEKVTDLCDALLVGTTLMQSGAERIQDKINELFS